MPGGFVATVRGADGVEIYYETWGRRDGEALLLIPGLGSDLRIWACQRLVFGRRYRCIAVDNRGSGRSGKPAGPYSLDQMADDALAVLDAEGVGRAHLLGYSMGTFIAQTLALANPERVRSLVLAGTAARHYEWRRELLASWSEVATSQGVHVMARRAVPYLLGPRNARVFGLWINLLWPLLLSQPAHAFAAQVEAILAFPEDRRHRLGELTAPALVLAGLDDRLTPPQDGAELASFLPAGRFATVSGAGHGMVLEQAPDFNGAVLGFLAGVPVDLSVAP